MTDHMHTPSPAPGLLGKAYAPTFKLIAAAAILGLTWLVFGMSGLLALIVSAGVFLVVISHLIRWRP